MKTDKNVITKVKREM